MKFTYTETRSLALTVTGEEAGEGDQEVEAGVASQSLGEHPAECQAAQARDGRVRGGGGGRRWGIHGGGNLKLFHLWLKINAICLAVCFEVSYAIFFLLIVLPIN